MVTVMIDLGQLELLFKKYPKKDKILSQLISRYNSSDLINLKWEKKSNGVYQSDASIDRILPKVLVILKDKVIVIETTHDVKIFR